MAIGNSSIKRLEIPYFDGLNSLVNFGIAKKTEYTACENIRSDGIGTCDKRAGMVLIGDVMTMASDDYLFYFPSSNASSKNLFKISSKAASPTKSSIFYLNAGDTWTELAGDGKDFTKGSFDSAIARGKTYLANYNDNNRYIDSDGTTVITSTVASGNFYGTPKAHCVAYYKNRLYLADFIYSSTRYKDTVLRSSYPLGIASLVNGDQTAPFTTIAITDTKYIYTAAGGNVYQIYRGPSQVGTFTATSVAGGSMTGTMVFAGGFSTVESADEVWVDGTYTGEKKFRWVANPSASGIQTTQYDTFDVNSSDGSEVKMLETIGNVLMIATNNNISIWNDFVLQNYDWGMGCVSRKGYVKLLGALYFMHYSGIFATNGDMPKLISSKVERYIYGATKAGKEASVAGKRGRSMFFTLGDVTLYRTDGSVEKVLNDVCLEYNVTQEDWYVHTGVKATDFCTFIDTLDADRLAFTSTETNCPTLEFLSGETDYNGKEIPMNVELPPLVLTGYFEKLAQPQEVVVELERGSGVKVLVSLDLGPFYELEGEAMKGATILKVTNKDGDRAMPPRCRTIRVALRHSLKQLVKVSRIAVNYIPTMEEEQQREFDS